GTVRFDAQQKSLAGRNHEHAAVREPIDATWKGRRLEDDLAVALEIDGDDLRRAPVGEPEPAFMPARLLAELDVRHQHLRLAHSPRSSGRRSSAIAPIPATANAKTITTIVLRSSGRRRRCKVWTWGSPAGCAPSRFADPPA